MFVPVISLAIPIKLPFGFEVTTIQFYEGYYRTNPPNSFIIFTYLDFSSP